MKRSALILVLVFINVCIISSNSASAVNISDFPTFQAAMASATQITLLNTITATAKIANQGQPTLTIDGGGFSINGNGQGGFSLIANRPLTINNITLENFIDNGNAGVITTGGSCTVNIGDGVQFLNNSGTGNSGVIFDLGAGNVINIGDNVVFTGNSASSGGVMFIAGNTSGATPRTQMTIGNNALFSNNSASGAGAIYNQFGNINIGDLVTFDNNRATGSGGGAIVNTAILNIGNNAAFLNNAAVGSGGAINNSSSLAPVTIGDNASFIGNSTSTGGGGAIYNIGTGVQVIIGDGAIFNNNTSRSSGGAISNNGIFTIGSAQFLNNSAETLSGGAINNSGTFTITGAATFTNNSVTSGSGGAISNSATISMGNGSLFDTNTTTGSGGAISNAGTNANVTIGTDAQFLNNSVTTGGGGAISNSGTNASVGIGSGAVFDNNRAISGGAISSGSSGARVTIGDGATFSNNSVTATTGSGGGAINNSTGSSIIIGDNATFFHNTGTFHGGAIFNLGANAIVEIGDGAMFLQNSSTTVGGVIFNNTATGIITIGDNATFSTNSSAGGGAIYNQAAGTGLTIGNGVTFSDNTTTATGGGIYNDGIITIGNSGLFTGNHANTNGGMIYNNSSGNITIGENATFTGNSAVSGGAIYNTGIINLAIGAVILNNTATNGGAFYNAAGTINMNSSTFTSNTATSQGGAIYGSGTLNLANVPFTSNSAALGGAIFIATGGNFTINDSSFSTNTATASGGAIYNTAILNLNSTLGDITFSGNIANSLPNDIYNSAAGTININGIANSVTINDGIAGSGTINKSNAGDFILNGSSALFVGIFNQTSGTTLVNTAFFGGTSNITGGILEFTNGSSLPNTGVIALGSSGTLDITGTAGITFGGRLTGSGVIDKTSSGTLFINGNDNAFTGTFNQTAGSTIVSQAGRMFGGQNNILNSTLQVTGLPIYYSVNLQDNAIFTNLVSTMEGGVISSSNIHFTGTNVIATFTKDPALVQDVNAIYTLANKIDNGQANTIIFDLADVIIGSTDYTGDTVYSFENSTIGLESTTFRSINFTNLNTNNSKIAFGLSFDKTASGVILNSDTLHVANVTGDGILGIRDIKVVNDHDDGLTGTREAQILFGSGLTFDTTTPFTNVSTIAYEYTTSIAPDGQSINLEVIRPSSENSLANLNTLAGNRGFNFSFFEGENFVYNIGGSLGETAEGTFIVQGFDSDPTHGVISGNIVTVIGGIKLFTGQQGSLFRLLENTDLVVANLTLQDAFIDGDGSAIFLNNPNAVAEIYNTIIQNNTSTGLGGAVYNAAKTLAIEKGTFNSNRGGSGGAIYNAGILEMIFDTFVSNTATADGGAVYSNAGTLTIDSTSFSNNIAGGNGGAIYTLDGELTLGTTSFHSNEAAGDGGAIYNTGVTTILGSTSFTNNTSGGRGGAIYNNSTLSLDSSYGNIIFSGNTADGIPNDIFNDNGTIDITGNGGTVSLADGIAGTGTIDKSSSGTLILGGENSNYTGNFNQTAGTTDVTGTFFSGPSDISIINSTLNLGAHAFFSGTNNLTVDNGTIDSINGAIQTNTINNLLIGPGGANFAIDVNGFEEISDQYVIANGITGTGIINISDINIVGEAPTALKIPFLAFDSPSIDGGIIFTTTNKLINTPIFVYRVVSDGNGSFSLIRLFGANRFNKQAFRGQVATMSAYYNQLIVNNILFDHVYLESETLSAARNNNKYAAINPLFAPYQYSREDGSLWYKSYVTFETLAMTQDLNVNNNNYGALIGADFPARSLGDGWKFLPTTYVAYNGGHQTFDGVSMYQNGGQGGFMGTFMKDNVWLSSILAYAGGYNNEMSVEGNKDHTGNWFAGVATKTAYNIRATRNLIIQPTALVSYNIFGNQHWGSNFGAVSMVSGFLNGINVAPGLNLIYNKQTWGVYAVSQYVFNINDRINGSIGNVNLPDLRMRHGYIEYGLGATKTWKDRLLGYAQITIRNGGRTGVGLQAGMMYKL